MIELEFCVIERVKAADSLIIILLFLSTCAYESMNHINTHIDSNSGIHCPVIMHKDSNAAFF